MRKKNVLWIIALTLVLAASLTLGQVNTVSAQKSPPVGVVVDYEPGQSITIADQQGSQHQFMLSSSLKILPSARANLLAVGSFVTIIAPNSLSNGKQVAVGIVIHPHVPNGWKIPSVSGTPLPTETPATFTSTPPGTLVTTGTVTATATETPNGTATAVGPLTDTLTPTATPLGGATTLDTTSFIEWLRSLFR